MNQKTLHDVHKATKANIIDWMPFQMLSDGDVIAIVTPNHDVHKLDKQLKASHDVHKGKALSPFSKETQAAGRMRST